VLLLLSGNSGIQTHQRRLATMDTFWETITATRLMLWKPPSPQPPRGIVKIQGFNGTNVLHSLRRDVGDDTERRPLL
jgi:hypothetical protein